MVNVMVVLLFSGMELAVKDLVMVGGVVTGKFSVFELPPPGAGFVTITG
jgi:hypothetical protein